MCAAVATKAPVKQRIMALSGKYGMVIHPMGLDDALHAVPCQATATLEEANQIASSLKTQSYGVVPSKRGWAVRILKSKVAELTSRINPERAQELGASMTVEGHGYS